MALNLTLTTALHSTTKAMKKKQQWEDIKAMILKINALIVSGTKFFDPEERMIVDMPFTIDEEKLSIHLQLSPNSRCGYYDHDPDYDHGYYNTVADLKQRWFAGWVIIKPEQQLLNLL